MPRSCGASPLTAEECTWVSVLNHWSAPAAGAVPSPPASTTAPATRHDRSLRVERRYGRALDKRVTNRCQPLLGGRLDRVRERCCYSLTSAETVFLPHRAC